MSNWIQQTSLEQRREEAFAQLPPAITEFARTAADTWRLEPSLVLAGAVHHLAGAGGRTSRLRHGHVEYACPFNMIITTDVPSRADWYEYMGEPWLGQARANVRLHQARGAQVLLAELNALLAPSPNSLGTAALLPAQEREALVRQKLAVLRSCVVSREGGGQAAVQALEQSFDRSILLLPGGTDPVLDLLSAGHRKVAELARVLEMSWQDQDMPAKGVIPLRGVVHLGWRSEAGHVRRLVLDRQCQWSLSPPPVLLLRQTNTPGFLPLPESATIKAWSTLLSGYFSRRVTLGTSGVWTLSPESEALLREFHDEVAEEPMPDLHPGWFNWLPSLVVRVALLVAGLDRTPTGSPSPPLVIQEDSMHRACVLTRRLAHEHYECLTWLSRPQAVEVPAWEKTADIDFIDMEQTKKQIAARLVEKGPLSPRELTRSFHKLSQKVRDAAVAGLIAEGSAIELPGGRLQYANAGRVSAELLTVSASAGS